MFWEEYTVHASDYRDAFERANQGDYDGTLEGRRLLAVRPIGIGEISNVFLAKTVAGLPERLIVKLLRSTESDDADLFNREVEVLRLLSGSKARGTEVFLQRVPQVAFSGTFTWKSGERLAGTALAYSSGFAHTLEDVRKEHGAELDVRHAIWIWRRLLETLGFVHESGLVHSAVLPCHVLVHARDHGVKLIGFSCAGARNRATRKVIHPRFENLYWQSGTLLRVKDDLAMSARTIGWVFEGVSMPSRLAEFIDRIANGDVEEHAFKVSEQLAALAREEFGAPTFVPLKLSGWG